METNVYLRNKNSSRILYKFTAMNDGSLEMIPTEVGQRKAERYKTKIYFLRHEYRGIVKSGPFDSCMETF